MTSPAQDIKEKLDIVEFIRSYITLLPAGKNFKAICPFHKERTPSFIVSPDRQTWHCFGSCAEGGDIFKFLMKHDNLEFYEALKVLAERAGVELKRASPAEYKQFGILFDINSVAKDFFKKELAKTPEVFSYAKERGLTPETIEEFELGFAPQSFDRLTLDLIHVGFSVQDIERAGVSFKTDRGGYMDRFRGRLMFPIHNGFGKVVGFSGRVLPVPQIDADQDADKRRPNISDNQRFDQRGSAFAAQLAKYINSPETPIFNKSRIFYGLHKTKSHIKEQGAAVLVEGQMDFLMLYQDGVKNVVATSGTALSPDHLRSIRRLTEELVLSFDNDEAGQKAAERSIDLAAANDFTVKLLELGEYKDPAEAVLEHPGVIAVLLEKAVPAMEFYFERYLGAASSIKHQALGSAIGSLKKNLRIVLAKIKNMASAIERAHWLKELADRTGINEKALGEEMEQLKSEIRISKFETMPQVTNDALIKTSRRDLIAERLLSLALVREDLKTAIGEYLEYLPSEYLLILDFITKKNMVGQKALAQERLAETVNLISLRSSFELETLGEEGIEEEFKALIKQIQNEFFKEKRTRLQLVIKEMEKNGEEEKMKGLLKEFQDISQHIND